MTPIFLGALALVAVLPSVPALADDHEVVDVGVVLAVDVSGSMDVEELAIQRAGYLDALMHPDFIRIVGAGRRGKIALSHFEWAGQVREGAIVSWRIVRNMEELRGFASEIAALPIRTSFGTSISGAIDYGVKLIDSAEFSADAWVIDVSGDGPNNMGPPVADARDRAIERGVTINGLPIVLRPSRGAPDLEAYYEACVIGGPASFVLAARSTEELAPAIRRKLFRELVGGVDARIWRAAEPEPIDCMIGERIRLQRGGQF
jgi:hypothetical protein